VHYSGREGSKNGAAAGIIIGFSICCYTLLAPYAIGTNQLAYLFKKDHGKLHYLNHLNFSLDYLNPIPHAV
jgi:hypothetical protein